MHCLIKKEPYQPRTHEIFWCNECDAKQVDSTDITTGSFFVFFGHAYQLKTLSYDGDYHGVMMAICVNCLK